MFIYSTICLFGNLVLVLAHSYFFFLFGWFAENINLYFCYLQLERNGIFLFTGNFVFLDRKNKNVSVKRSAEFHFFLYAHRFIRTKSFVHFAQFFFIVCYVYDVSVFSSELVPKFKYSYSNLQQRRYFCSNLAVIWWVLFGTI